MFCAHKITPCIQLVEMKTVGYNGLRQRGSTFIELYDDYQISEGTTQHLWGDWGSELQLLIPWTFLTIMQRYKYFDSYYKNYKIMMGFDKG